MVGTRGKRKILHVNDKSHLQKKIKPKKNDETSTQPSTSSSTDMLAPKKPRRNDRDRSVSSTGSNKSFSSSKSTNGYTTSKSNVAAKPVFVDASYKTLNNILSNISFTGTSKPMLKVISPIKTQVCCASASDKEALLEKLKIQQFKFFTFSEPSTKPLIYVLKGYPKEDCVEIKNLLVENELPVNKVTFLVDSDYPVYLAHFTRQQEAIKNVNLHFLQHTSKHVGNVIVKWERFDRSRKRLTQCFKCQMFGHTATNCGRDYKCVKCIEDHLPGECNRKSKDQDGSPKCVNCQGDHTANSHICPHYQSYADKVKRQRVHRQDIDSFRQTHQSQRTRASTRSHQQAPDSNAKNFPPLLGKKNVSTRNESEPQTYANFSNLQSRFNAIPGIAQSLKKFEAFVSKLESARSESERQLILLDFYTSNQNVY